MFELGISKNGPSGHPSRKWHSALGWTVLFALAVIGLQAGSEGPFLSGAHGTVSAAAPESLAIKVLTRREGERTHFYVENRELCEVTMTFEVESSNLRSDRPLPCTATFLPGQTEAFSLSPIASGSKWEYCYTNYYKLGSNCARHDDTCEYELPYRPGSAFTVTQ